MKCHRWLLLFLVAVSLVLCLSFCSERLKKTESYRIMFYNVENLFDTINNPLTNDEEYLPKSEKHWNNYRYWQKVKKLYQAIAATGESDPPDIIGFAEIECMLPLINLTKNTPLSKFEYSITHKDSPDSRGIDVALLCRKDRVKVLSSRFVNPFSNESAQKTRDILLASLKINNDTIFVLVNHWPSRRGGEARSDVLRFKVSEKVKEMADSLIQLNPYAKILIMGDFNDEPTDESIRNLTKYGFTNLSDSIHSTCRCGTYKFKSQWQMFDQMLVSKSFQTAHGLKIIPESFHIVKPEYMLTTDSKYGGKTPYRTYLGPRYIGGYSDHLPIAVDVK